MDSIALVIVFSALKAGIIIEILSVDSIFISPLFFGIGCTIYKCQKHIKEDTKCNFYDACHNKGIKIIPWTVNEEQDILRIADLNVDGIISDYPDRLIKLLR